MKPFKVTVDVAKCVTEGQKRCCCLWIGALLSITAVLTLASGTWAAVTILWNNKGMQGSYATQNGYTSRYVTSGREVYFTLGAAVYISWTASLQRIQLSIK